jgi:hypothetical protein
MKTLIDSIVKYWVDFLKDPNSFVFDNGDNSRNGQMAIMMANMGKPKSYPRAEIDAFQEMLYNEIAKGMPTGFYNDYHADNLLAKVADATLSRWSDMNTFPVKTSMNIDYKAGIVTVSQGYNAPTRILFEEENCE